MVVKWTGIFVGGWVPSALKFSVLFSANPYAIHIKIHYGVHVIARVSSKVALKFSLEGYVDKLANKFLGNNLKNYFIVEH